MVQSSTVCSSKWTSAIYENLCPFHQIFVCRNNKSLETNLLSLFCTMLQVLAHYISFVSGHPSAETAHLTASCPMFKPLFKIHQYVLYDRPSQPNGWLAALLLFTCSNINIDDLKFLNSQLKFVKFWPVNTIQKSLSCSWNHQRRFYETFHVSQKEVSQGFDWIWCIFSVCWGVPLYWAETITENIQHTQNN